MHQFNRGHPCMLCTLRQRMSNQKKQLIEQHVDAAWKPKSKQQTQQSVPSDPFRLKYPPEGF